MPRLPSRFVLLAMTIAVGASVLLGLILFNREPRYHGQPVSYWTELLYSGSQKQRAEARVALRAMGPSAVPPLMHAIEQWTAPESPSPIHRAFEHALGYVMLKAIRIPVVAKVLVHNPPIPEWQATFALGEIGPAASNAIPLLEKFQRPPNNQDGYYGNDVAATAALMKIRGESVTPLIEQLKSHDWDWPNWTRTTHILAQFGTNAQPAVPLLCPALQSTSFEVSWGAAYALGAIHSDPEVSVPALVEAMKHNHVVDPGRNPTVQAKCIWALGQFEGKARVAVPLLRQQVSSTNVWTRLYALDSLNRILPPEELKSLVPALLANVNDPYGLLRTKARRLLKQIDPDAATKAGVE